ncbi:MAG: hypothetical protein H8D22_12890 [Candidatus Cloacimonetes bacterium]|nr:hypothetical protein [Candidatus Cloacimonadota bacterium]
MIYSALIEDIIKRVDAAYVETHIDRTKELFLSVVAILIGKKEYTVNDIPELISEEEVTLADTGKFKVLGATNDFTGNPNVIDITEIYNDPDAGDSGFIYTPKEIDAIGSIHYNEELEPASKEIYYYRVGEYLKFYKKTTANGKKPTIIYAESPAQWEDTDEMVGKYSMTFIQKCADLTALKLKSEIDEQGV